MRSVWVLAFLVACATAGSLNKQPTVNESGKIRYDNYKVYKLNIKNKLQLKVFDLIQDFSEKVIE